MRHLKAFLLALLLFAIFQILFATIEERRQEKLETQEMLTLYESDGGLD